MNSEANGEVNSEANGGMNSETNGEVMNSDAEASEEAFVETLNEVNIEANEEGSGTTRLVDELLEASNEEQRSEHQQDPQAGGHTLHCTLYTVQWYTGVCTADRLDDQSLVQNSGECNFFAVKMVLCLKTFI
jgi:hypothetical protein